MVKGSGIIQLYKEIIFRLPIYGQSSRQGVEKRMLLYYRIRRFRLQNFYDKGADALPVCLLVLSNIVFPNTLLLNLKKN